MCCSKGNSTKKGKYNKKQNLEKPIDYIIDKKGNLKPIYKK